jgi:hypothetical protein
MITVRCLTLVARPAVHEARCGQDELASGHAVSVEPVGVDDAEQVGTLLPSTSLETMKYVGEVRGDRASEFSSARCSVEALLDCIGRCGSCRCSAAARRGRRPSRREVAQYDDAAVPDGVDRRVDRLHHVVGLPPRPGKVMIG